MGAETIPSRRSIASELLLVAFFMALWLPLADRFVGLDATPGPMENRRLAQAPGFELTHGALRTYPARFDAFYKDNFGFRNRLLRHHHAVAYGWLKLSDPDQVLRGKEGWLFLAKQGLSDEARGLAPMNEREVDAWHAALLDAYEWQTDRGGRFLLVIVPDKHSVMSEYLPNWFKQSGKPRRKAQIIERISLHTPIPILELSNAMLQAKSEFDFPIWYKTDTHWTGMGALAADDAIARYLARKWYEGFEPIERDRLRPIELDDVPQGVEGFRGDLAQMLGVRAQMPEKWRFYAVQQPRYAPIHDYPEPSREMTGTNRPYATEHLDRDLPSALVVGGSFRWALTPYFSEHFSRVLYVDHRHTFFDTELFERENPDLLMYLLTERQFLWFPKPPPSEQW